MKSKFLVFGSLLALAACNNGAPEGQVVASVNGEEITRAELNAELKGIKTDSKVDAKTVQNAVLDRMISQRLVVQAAKQEQIDKSQDYILASRKSNEAILTQLFARKVTSGLRTPYDNDVRAFIAANPWRFAQRQVIVVDQIRAEAASVQQSWVAQSNSMDAVAATLTAHGIQFQRGRATVDSATLDGPTFEKLGKLADRRHASRQRRPLIQRV